MRSAVIAVLVLSPHLAAGPAPAGKPRTEKPPPWADAYAQQVLSVVSQVSASYIRPVSRTYLLQSAVAGLYEAARQPLPPALAADLKTATSDEAIQKVLVQAREPLGNGQSLKDHEVLLASCRAMLRHLDPYSDVLLEAERKNVPWGDQPAGLGFELRENVGVGPLLIHRVLPGTPAQRAGLRPGDEITQVDKKALKGLNRDEVAGLLTPSTSPHLQALIDGKEAAAEAATGMPRVVTLQIARPGRKRWTVSLEYQERKPESVFGVQRRDDNSWEFLIDRERRIAHVRIEALNKGTANELAEVLERLQANRLGGLILDLRWSPGGFLDEATGIAGLFLGDKVIASKRGRTGAEKYHNTQARRYEKVPLVVLVNEQTSGGSELIAAALQDHKRAAVAGQRSHGKATVQQALYVDIPGASLKLTEGEFVRPSGKNLHRGPDSRPQDDWGIRPDTGLECRLSPQLTRELKEQWDLQTLRPGVDNKVLPMDDPKNDPQRQLALEYLLRRLRRSEAR